MPSVALLLSFFGAEMPPGTTPGSLRAHPPEVSPAPLSSSQMIHSSHHSQTRSFGLKECGITRDIRTSERVNLNAQPKKKTNAQTRVKRASKCAPCEERKIRNRKKQVFGTEGFPNRTISRNQLSSSESSFGLTHRIVEIGHKAVCTQRYRDVCALVTNIPSMTENMVDRDLRLAPGLKQKGVTRDTEGDVQPREPAGLHVRNGKDPYLRTAENNVMDKTSCLGELRKLGRVISARAGYKQQAPKKCIFRHQVRPPNCSSWRDQRLQFFFGAQVCEQPPSIKFNTNRSCGGTTQEGSSPKLILSLTKQKFQSVS